ncbi:MAG: LysE family transporter [Syntrophorhabdales bacterium]|jgi:threonine/homoserine/homoserine lactone efflux protein
MTIPALFSIGFVLGLTGAMAPGPLLTVTIAQSARRGGIIGPLLVAGHGILELVLVLLIVFGVGSLLHNNLLFAVISFFGGAILVYMGAATMRGLKTYSLDTQANPSGRELHPVLSGILASISNPYWFIWWLTIGMWYVMSARSLGLVGILAFFTGHILSDLTWYSFVSYGMQLGGRRFNTKKIKAVLFVCSLFLVFFGLFFMVKGFQFL